MNKESPEYERVREDALLTDEEIGKVCNCETVADHDWFDILLPWCKRATQAQLDKALKTKGICIKADDQSLPKPEMLEFNLPSDTLMVSKAGVALEQNLSPTYSKAQQDMLKKGFVKVVNNAK